MAITASSSKQALVDLINKDNTLALKLADLNLAAPVLVDGKDGSATLNTTVKVTGANSTTLPGEVTVTYTRPSVKQLLAVSNWKVPSSTDASSAAIAAAVKTGLVEDTIKSVPLEDGSFTVTALLMAESEEGYTADYPWKVTVDFSGHYILSEVATLYIAVAAESLNDQVKTTELSGFSNDDVKPAAQ